MRSPVRVCALLGVIVLVAGCGGSGHHGSTQSTSTSAARTGTQGVTGTSPGTGPSGAAPGAAGNISASDTAVITNWANALRAGNIGKAASFFAIPSIFDNEGAVRIESPRGARIVNEALPCGATFLYARQHGRFDDAEFKLGGRQGPGGTPCSGTARVEFRIAGGKIHEWIRAPGAVPKSGGAGPDGGGSGSPGTGTGSGTTPAPVPTVPTTPATPTTTSTGPPSVV